MKRNLFDIQMVLHTQLNIRISAILSTCSYIMQILTKICLQNCNAFSLTYRLYNVTTATYSITYSYYCVSTYALCTAIIYMCVEQSSIGSEQIVYTRFSYF